MTTKTRGWAAPVLLAFLAAAAGAQEPQQPEAAAQGVQQPETTAQSDRPTLELSMDETVARALENNADIAVQRYNPESSAQSIREATGVYDPVFFSTLTKSSRTTPASNVFAGATKVDTNTDTFNFGVSQYLPSGANLRVDFNNNRQDSNSVFTTFNPSFNSSFNLNLTQPLLRGFKLDRSRLQLKVARRNNEISEVQFRQTVINTTATVKQQYYDLIYAIDNLGAQRKSLSLAQKLLEENQIKVKVGTLAPLDVVSAESEVASREEGVIVAEAALLEAEDALKRSIFPSNQPENWPLRIVPTDRPTAEPVQVDVTKALDTALQNRTDVVAARKALENAGLNLDYARSQRLPGIDLTAAYGTTGIGGTSIERDGFGGPIIRTIPGGYGDAVSDVFGREFPTWTIGVNISYPIMNRQASAAAARSQVARDQQEASLRRLELQVAVEVRSAARAVETNYKRVESSRAARVLRERQLDAEEKKFAAGMSTNFQVTQAQRDLALAEAAQIRAIADYRKSLVNFDRVQEAGGGVSFASSSSTSSSNSGSLTSVATQSTQ